MRAGAVRVVLLTGVLSLGATLVVSEPGAATDGYHRVKVTPAGISLLVPDDYAVLNEVASRADARRALEEHPEWAEAGITVATLLGEPFFAAVDLDGDSYGEHTLVVRVHTDERSLPTPDALVADLTESGYRAISVAPDEVAGRPALVARFRADVAPEGADEGVTVPFQQVAYEFVSPKVGTVVSIGFGRDLEGPLRRHKRTITTIVESVKLLS